MLISIFVSPKIILSALRNVLVSQFYSIASGDYPLCKTSPFRSSILSHPAITWPDKKKRPPIPGTLSFSNILLMISMHTPPSPSYYTHQSVCAAAQKAMLHKPENAF